MPNISEINDRLRAAAEQSLEECLAVAETKVLLGKSADEDNDQYVKRVSSVTEAKKKALKSAYEIMEMIKKAGDQKDGENGETGEGGNESKVQLITPEVRAKH